MTLVYMGGALHVGQVGALALAWRIGADAFSAPGVAVAEPSEFSNHAADDQGAPTVIKQEVTELHNVADVLEGHEGERLHGDLICYSRSVIYDEWPAMARGETSGAVQHWVDTMVRDVAATDPGNPNTKRPWPVVRPAGPTKGRSPRPRRRGATVGAAAAVGRAGNRVGGHPHIYVCPGRPSGKRRRSGGPIAFVSALVTSALLVVAFLDHPYADWAGNLQPDEISVTLSLIDDGHAAPCDSKGDPT